jgi:hypothetical protein
MAVTKQVTSQVVSQREQTWRINFELPSGGEPSIQLYRETVPLDAEDNAVGPPIQSYIAVNRRFVDVEEETVTFDDGTEIAFRDIVEALSELGDKWAAEDAEAPPPASPPPPQYPPPEPASVHLGEPGPSERVKRDTESAKHAPGKAKR